MVYTRKEIAEEQRNGYVVIKFICTNQVGIEELFGDGVAGGGRWEEVLLLPPPRTILHSIPTV
jgi:hypothetical protein